MQVLVVRIDSTRGLDLQPARARLSNGLVNVIAEVIPIPDNTVLGT